MLYRNQLIRVDTGAEIGAPAVPLGEVSQCQVGAGVSGDPFIPTQDLLGVELSGGVEEEQPERRPDDMAADHIAFNIFLVVRNICDWKSKCSIAYLTMTMRQS